MLRLRATANTALAIGLLLGGTAQTSAEDAATPPPRPRIGVVLSGGGARGIAHVGVLKALEELRIPVDYVAGTSMGAVVGGLYASGMSSSELEHAVENIDWGAVFDDRTPRQDVSFRRKQDSFDFLTGLRVWIKDFRVALPKGLIFGQKLRNLLAELSLPAATIRDFDELPIPFRAVATDTATGDAVILGSGELVTAIFASMAIPGVFTPVEIDGKLLVDGGVSKNLPVDVVQAMGADIVIAVDIAEPLLQGEEVTSVFSVSGQSLTVLLLRNTAEQVALLSDRDLLIKPELVGFGAASFDQGEALIDGGFAAAEAIRERLSFLSLSEERYAEFQADRKYLSKQAPVITQVAYDNRSPLSDYVIEERFDIVLGRPLDLDDLERNIAMLYGEEIFDRVTFALEDTPEGTELILRTYGKEQGRNYLRFGLQLESDFQGESNFDLAILMARNPVNSLAGEWRSKLQVGDETRFYTEFFQPFTPRSRLFVLPSFAIGLTTRDVFNQGGDRLAKYRISDLDAQLAIGTHLSNVAEIKLGAGYRNGTIERTSGDPELFPDQDFDGFFAFGRATIDTLDSVVFPRSGAYGFIEGDYVPGSTGGRDDVQVASASFNYAWSFGETTVVPSAFFGTTFGDADALPTFSLGGFLELSGLPPESRTGSTALLGRLLAYHRIANPRIISWSLPVYLGASLEFGNTFDDVDEIAGKRIDLAGSVFLGVDTFLGPIYIAYGHAEGGHNAGYIFLGQVF